MKKTCISKDWFLSTDRNPVFSKIDLPNDYVVTAPRRPDALGGAANGFFPSCNATYAKYLTLGDKPHHYILDIDGAYMCARIMFNEYQLAMHPHGYTPYLVDLTAHARPGHTNKLVISILGLQQSTRWYSGAGIYRDIFLWEGGDIRIEPRNTFITTPDTTGTVNVSSVVQADRTASVTVLAEIIDGATGSTASSFHIDTALQSGQNSLSFTLHVASPKLWSPDDPNLYTLRLSILENGTEIESDETKFGIRTISANARTGFLINGKHMRLHGGCIHHDHGVLGAADYPAACRRKLILLRKGGFNALRIAHNPPSRQLLDMCDEMGIIVIDEAFDCWHHNKGGCVNYHLWFDDWCARDIEYMVTRDRNHPCVIAYSIGNEIPESGGNSAEGGEISARLAAEVRKHDNTRFVTSATFDIGYYQALSCDPPEYRKDTEHYVLHDESEYIPAWRKRVADYFAPLDICGYNYIFPLYEEEHKHYPDRVIWSSETHSLRFYDSWASVMSHPYVLGDFVWTAYDNLGEAGTGRSLWARDGVIKCISQAAYPWRTCYQGDLDLCGFRRPQSFFRETIWQATDSTDGVPHYTEPRIFTTHPEHWHEDFSGTGWHWHDVHESWTFAEKYIGKPVTCEVYSMADEIAWLLNGKELGRSKPEKAIASFDIPYEKGVISAIAYKDGKEVGRSSLHTTCAPAEIHVTAETQSVIADNRDLCYFDINITDANGDRVTDSKAELTCVIDGGELLGIFSADPANEDQYGSNVCHAFDGRAVAIVRTSIPGTVSITVGSRGLRAGHADVKAL